MYSGQGVEQAMPGSIISPVTHVQAADEGYEPPLVGLLAHVGVTPWGSPMSRAVVTRAAPPKLPQLVFGPVGFTLATPRAHCIA